MKKQNILLAPNIERNEMKQRGSSVSLSFFVTFIVLRKNYTNPDVYFQLTIRRKSADYVSV